MIERGPRLGGLAGSFEAEGRFYPLGYHHILDRDRTLLFFLARLGALPRVEWRRIRMLFEERGRLFDLASPAGMLAYPLPLLDKVRLGTLVLARGGRATGRRGRGAARRSSSTSGPARECGRRSSSRSRD